MKFFNILQIVINSNFLCYRTRNEETASKMLEAWKSLGYTNYGHYYGSFLIVCPNDKSMYMSQIKEIFSSENAINKKPSWKISTLKRHEVEAILSQ